MNETFSFRRFLNYFLYDNSQMWSRHTKAVVTFGGLGLILYVVWVVIGLIFTQSWQGPALWARTLTLSFASLVLIFYQTRTYGYLTEPKAGAAWLMLPASRLEKFISMMVITVIEMPLAFVAVYLCVDGLIALLDPTVEGAIIGSFSELISEFNRFVADSGQDLSLGITSGGLIFQFWLHVCTMMLFFLLCGICFRKNKIITGIAILIAISLLVTILGGVVVQSDAVQSAASAFADGMAGASVERVEHLMNFVANSEFVANGIYSLGFAVGIFFRIKSLKH